MENISPNTQVYGYSMIRQWTIFDKRKKKGEKRRNCNVQIVGAHPCGRPFLSSNLFFPFFQLPIPYL